MKVLLPLVILISACVTTGTYNRKVAELTKLRDDEAATAKQRERTLDEKIADLQRTVSELQGKVAETQVALDKATADKAVLQKQLDDDTALIATMKQRLRGSIEELAGHWRHCAVS